MRQRQMVDWAELRKFTDLTDLVLDEDLESLRAEPHATLAGWRDQLAAYWERFRSEWAPALKGNLHREIRSRVKLAHLLLETSSHQRGEADPPSSGAFGSREMELLRDFERYKALDVLTEEEIAQGVINGQHGLFELAVDFYNKVSSLRDYVMV